MDKPRTGCSMYMYAFSILPFKVRLSSVRRSRDPETREKRHTISVKRLSAGSAAWISAHKGRVALACLDPHLATLPAVMFQHLSKLRHDVATCDGVARGRWLDGKGGWYGVRQSVEERREVFRGWSWFLYRTAAKLGAGESASTDSWG
jgi:hypothetical protein